MSEAERAMDCAFAWVRHCHKQARASVLPWRRRDWLLASKVWRQVWRTWNANRFGAFGLQGNPQVSDLVVPPLPPEAA